MHKKKLLDVGCGDAKKTINYAQENFIVVGIEKNKEVFELAKKNIRKANQGKNIILINDDIIKIKLKTKFDFIYFSYVLMFVSKKDALKLIDNFYKNLKKEGEMIIEVLMSDDETIKKISKKETFFPTKKEFLEIGKNFNTKPVFKKIIDKPHGSEKSKHTHSVGIIKIIKQ